MKLTRQQLLDDLRQAYYDARRHKRNRPYQIWFERQSECNLRQLCDELYARTYQPKPSSCFIITDPKKREVFAAEFRDRIVHHLYYNYVHTLLERTFIHDSYSCIKGRGTHFGVKRLDRHIRSCSHNYQLPCFVLKMDIRGYFMHIDRNRLESILWQRLWQMHCHKVSKYRRATWEEELDYDFLQYLTHLIVQVNPKEHCKIKGERSDWDDLPHDKSLFHTPAGCGLPIGNLTSQLFSNVYLNELDQYVKRTLHCRHYGRYVDDFYIVGNCRSELTGLIAPIRGFLSEKLGLQLHEGKTTIYPIERGVPFLGAFVKPYRNYVDNQTVDRMDAKLYQMQLRGARVTGVQKRQFAGYLQAALNSFAGVLSHGRSSHLRHWLLRQRHDFTPYGCWSSDGRRFETYSPFS